MAVRVRLYTRADCHLCEVAQAMLLRVARDAPISVERVDIATLGEAAPQYAERIPVIEVEDEEAQAGKISEWRLRSWMRERGYLDASR